MQAGFQLICLLGLAIVRSQGGLSTEKPVFKEEFKFDLMNFPKAEYGGYPDLVSGKTNFLLEEAENMLSRVKVFKERLWLQTFVFKMRKLAAMVKQSIISDVDKKSQEREESFGENFKGRTLQASMIQSGEESPSANRDDPVISHPTSNVQSPEEQHTVTMPNIHELRFKTGQYNTDQQGFQKMRQDHKLVRELEELPRIAAVDESERKRRPVKRSNLMAVYEAANEMEKRKIETELGKEILKLKEMGSSPYEIELALALDEPMNLKLLRPYIPSYSDRLKMLPHGHGIHKDKSAEKTMTYHRNDWKNNIKLPTQPSTNTSLEENHISLFPVKEYIDKYQTGPHTHHTSLPPSIQNLLRKLHRENYLLKRRLKAIGNGNLDKVKGSSRISPYHPNLVQNSPHPYNRNKIVLQRYGIRNPFTPTSDIRSLDPFTPTSNIRSQYPFNPASNIKSVDPFTPSSKNADTFTPISNNSEFSEEIKKELIDGKVILLSHSVVPSNFDTGKDLIPTQSDDKNKVQV